MRRWITLEKKIGETPLEALTAWKREHPRYADVPLTYAGRLDPMASGTLLLLLGEECKRKEHYTGLNKEYEIEVLLDLTSDTGDVLGLPSYRDSVSTPSHLALKTALSAVQGTHQVPYPQFSSKTVNGKPLFQYTLEGTIDTIEIPEHEETVYRTRLLDVGTVSKQDLHARIERLLLLAPTSDEPSKILGADFRQEEIRAAWKEVFNLMPDRTFTVIRIKVTCASGTYMRTLAARIAKELQTTGLALSIHRSRIGRYAPLPMGPGVWTRRF